MRFGFLIDHRICLVTELYKRSDGIVDFNSNTCIGCKACMQACPDDALYYDRSGAPG